MGSSLKTQERVKEIEANGKRMVYIREESVGELRKIPTSKIQKINEVSEGWCMKNK